MSPEQMRQQVLSAYEGDNWRKKVQNMTDAQLYAVWMRLKRSGRIK